MLTIKKPHSADQQTSSSPNHSVAHDISVHSQTTPQNTTTDHEQETQTNLLRDGTSIPLLESQLEITQEMKEFLKLTPMESSECSKAIKRGLKMIQDIESQNCSLQKSEAGESYYIKSFREQGEQVFEKIRLELINSIGNNKGEYVSAKLRGQSIFNDWGSRTMELYVADENGLTYFFEKTNLESGAALGEGVKKHNVPNLRQRLITQSSRSDIERRYPYVFIPK